MTADDIMTRILWFAMGGLLTSIIVRIDRPECFAPGSIAFPAVGLALTATMLITWRILWELTREN